MDNSDFSFDSLRGVLEGCHSNLVTNDTTPPLGTEYNKSMLDFTPNPNYRKNEEKVDFNFEIPCIICGKGISEPWKHTVHLFYGYTLVTEDEAKRLLDAGDSGDMGAYPIGSDCLKKHREILPYVIKENA